MCQTNFWNFAAVAIETKKGGFNFFFDPFHQTSWTWTFVGNRNDRNMVQHVLLPVNIHFHWNLFIFEFLMIFSIFILVAILKILKTKSTTLSDDLFLCQVSKPFRFAMVAILNPKWPPKYHNPPIWAKFGFQVYYDVANWYPNFTGMLSVMSMQTTFGNDFFNFYIGGHFENFKNKEHNFEWWSIFVSSIKRIRCLEWI
jgi:Ulp1 family protease